MGKVWWRVFMMLLVSFCGSQALLVHAESITIQSGSLSGTRIFDLESRFTFTDSDFSMS
jgi:hypothetical protein